MKFSEEGSGLLLDDYCNFKKGISLVCGFNFFICIMTLIDSF